MTEELKQAISALQCAKRGHCDHAMADEAIAALEALTQRPAAQAGEVDERVAFEIWYADHANRNSRFTFTPQDIADLREDDHYGEHRKYLNNLWEGWQARASLPTQPAAQDEREADEVFLPRRLAATQKLTQLGYRYDSAHGKWLPAPQQATPEPLGEPFGHFRALPFGWEQCGEHDDGAVALYTRPAPGVPDDAEVDRILSTSIPGGSAARDWFLPHETPKGLANVRDVVRAMLAAAQAKGGAA